MRTLLLKLYPLLKPKPNLDEKGKEIAARDMMNLDEKGDAIAN